MFCRRIALWSFVLCGLGCTRQPLPYGPRVVGRFDSEGGSLGNFALRPNRCYRTAGGNFDLTDAQVHAQVVRVGIGGPSPGTSVVVRVANRAAPGGPGEVTLDRAVCAQHVGFTHPANLDGAIQLDCEVPGGGRFRGYATFAGCPP